MRLPWQRHKDLTERARAARAEAELSQRRLESVRRNVTGPLQKAGERNRFAEVIRLSLLEGHHQ
jgi:hypothetical protein